MVKCERCERLRARLKALLARRGRKLKPGLVIFMSDSGVFGYDGRVMVPLSHKPDDVQ